MTDWSWINFDLRCCIRPIVNVRSYYAWEKLGTKFF